MDVLDFTPEISVIQLPSKANLEVELTDVSDVDLSSVLSAKIRLFIISTQMNKCLKFSSDSLELSENSCVSFLLFAVSSSSAPGC